MGVVYKARDRRGGVVAVKTLARLDPARLMYLKREFSELADLRHENLVTVYEQIAEGENWFCVMEYVDGVHFLDFVRGGSGSADTDTVDVRDNPRLRPAFAQLAAGIRVLHSAGKLHRDIKSTNALVTAAGRVKLLDFGLVTDIEPDREPSGTVGTFDYMSPEQLGGHPLTEPSDWYSFGTLLYAALCGRLPFVGNWSSIVRAKEAGPPPRPSEFAPASRSTSKRCAWNCSRSPLRRGQAATRSSGASAGWSRRRDRPLTTVPRCSAVTRTSPCCAPRPPTCAAPAARWSWRCTARPGWARRRWSNDSCKTSATPATRSFSPGGASSRVRCRTRPSTASSTRCCGTCGG